ncbi:MAG: hypothetical protein HQK49_18820 [Oligoflexia bacterium]|nr:hypothetical protein [Oligoflexia bacterium]
MFKFNLKLSDILSSNLFFILILTITILLPIKNCFSSIYFEPFVGYALNGKADKKENSTNTTYKWKYSSPGYGARLGFTFNGPFASLEYTQMKYELKGEDPTVAGVTDESQKLDGSLYGLCSGYEFSMGFFFRSTFFYSELKKKDDQGPYSNGDTYQGMGGAVALGYRILSHLTLSAEYRKLVYKIIKLSGTRYNLDGGRELNMSEIFISIAVPFGGDNKK